MNSAEVMDVLREAMIVTLKIGGPVMVISVVIGLIISLFQALTQIQEATLTFVPKVLVIYGVLLLLLPFMLSTLITFTHQIVDRIIGMGAG
jgi:flagellar biosynthetic protein FliQ